MKPFRSGDVKLPPLNITEVRETSARGQVPGETDPETLRLPGRRCVLGKIRKGGRDNTEKGRRWVMSSCDGLRLPCRKLSIMDVPPEFLYLNKEPGFCASPSQVFEYKPLLGRGWTLGLSAPFVDASFWRETNEKAVGHQHSQQWKKWVF